MTNNNQQIHFSNNRCENCGATNQNHLETVQFFTGNQVTIRSSNSYEHVCTKCFQNRKNIYANIFPDQCEVCQKTMTPGDAIFSEESISKNLVICESCFDGKMSLT